MSQDKVVKNLNMVLADTYAIYLKSQNYHWNVSGKHFYILHKMLETQYTALSDAIDEIAERIKTLNAKAEGSFESFAKLTSISNPIDPAKESDIIPDLLKSHEAIQKTIQNALNSAKILSDEATIGLMVERLSYHQKIVWMLRSSIPG